MGVAEHGWGAGKKEEKVTVKAGKEREREIKGGWGTQPSGDKETGKETQGEEDWGVRQREETDRQFSGERKPERVREMAKRETKKKAADRSGERAPAEVGSRRQWQPMGTRHAVVSRAGMALGTAIRGTRLLLKLLTAGECGPGLAAGAAI